MPLVPNRSCGACTLCCVLPAIDTVEFSKQAGVACRFRVEGLGCSIHETRPPVCHDWFCGWRQLPLLDDAWRPDRSGLLVVLGADEIPEGLVPYQTTKFVIAEPSAWRPTRSFLSYIVALAQARAAIYLAVPGPAGHHQLKGLVNGALAPVVAARNEAAVADLIVSIVADLAQGPFEPVVLAHAPSGQAGV